MPREVKQLAEAHLDRVRTHASNSGVSEFPKTFQSQSLSMTLCQVNNLINFPNGGRELSNTRLKYRVTIKPGDTDTLLSYKLTLLGDFFGGTLKKQVIQCRLAI